MTTDHRAEAEKEIRLIKRLTEFDDIRDSITVASMHALLAIHDLLAARLPEPEQHEHEWLHGFHTRSCMSCDVVTEEHAPGDCEKCDRHRAGATPPPASPAAPVSDDPAPEAPVDPQDATGPQKGAGRIGWLRQEPNYPFRYLARGVDGGWSDKDNDTPVWIDTDWPEATFTPLLPGFFVAPDVCPAPTICRETDGEPMMWRTPFNAAFFDAVAGLLETREEA